MIEDIRFYFLYTYYQSKVSRIGGEPLRDDSIFFAQLRQPIGVF